MQRMEMMSTVSQIYSAILGWNYVFIAHIVVTLSFSVVMLPLRAGRFGGKRLARETNKKLIAATSLHRPALGRDASRRR
jgi:hypothetical protein